MSDKAFGETLQFITNVKLRELERLNADFLAHSDKLLQARGKAPNNRDALVQRLKDLIEGMSAWPHSWSQDFKLKAMKRFAELASRDPSFSTRALTIWIERAEAEIEHQKTRFRFAQLFGTLLTDWTQSQAKEAPTDQADQFEQVSRKETLEQKAKLESIIFEEKDIDVKELRQYLDELFASEQAQRILADEREKMKEFSKNLRKRVVQENEVKILIKSVLRDNILSETKGSLLRDFFAQSLCHQRAGQRLDDAAGIRQFLGLAKGRCFAGAATSTEWQDSLLPRRRAPHSITSALRWIALGD